MRWDQERRRAVGLGCERLRSGMQELRYSRALPPASVPAETRHAGSRTVGQLQPARPRDLPTPEWGSPPGFRAARCAGSPGMGQGGARHTGRADRWVCGLRGPPGVRVARIATYAGRTDHWNRRDEARIRGVASRPRLPRRRGVANRSTGRREAIGPGNRGARPLPFRAHIQPRGRPGPHRRTVPGARPPRHGDREALRGALGVPHRWARRRRDAVRRPNP